MIDERDVMVFTLEAPLRAVEKLNAGVGAHIKRDCPCVAEVAGQRCPGIMHNPRLLEIVVCPACGQRYFIAVVADESTV